MVRPSAAAQGADRTRFPPQVFDPEAFLEQFFGKQTAEQKRRLEEIEISWKDEQRFGKEAAKRFLDTLRRDKIRVVSRGREVRYLQSLVAQIRPQMRHAARYRSITVMLAESPDTDARCFPSGILVIYRGMLDFAQSEAALVGVLAHELSHVDHGHQLRHLKSMKLAERTFTGVAGMADLQQMLNNTMLITQTFSRPFRPEDESEADLDGATWAYRAGYDPRELAKLFLRMHQRRPEPNMPIPSFFRSHPRHRERYEAVMRRYQELAKTEPRERLYVGQRNLILLVPRTKRQFDETP
jgi:predicted Zn-dependent protease